HGYRLCIPVLHAADHNLTALGILSEEQARQVALWRVLLAGARTAARDDWIRRLRDLGMQVRIADDIVATLHAVEAPGEFSVLVLERKLLGDEAAALLRAVRKLRPHSGLVVLSEDELAWSGSLHIELIREAAPSLETLLQAMLRSVEPPVTERTP
ncbi:MAG: hypothetical protein KKC51_12195, partial [Verrucomicrobia bacterium]|nr:hypothetical protein [Verrucomicrobiota bacterium]